MSWASPTLQLLCPYNRQQLVELQGAGKSLRVPARNRLMDDILLQTLHELQTAGHQRVQVVNIGCGMVRIWLVLAGGCCRVMHHCMSRYGNACVPAMC